MMRNQYDRAIYDFEVAGPNHPGLAEVIAAIAEQMVEELDSGEAFAGTCRIEIYRPKEPGMALNYDPDDDDE